MSDEEELYSRTQHLSQIVIPIMTRSEQSEIWTHHIVCEAASIDFGVCVRHQGEMGLGLVAGRHFSARSPITQYEGRIIDRSEAATVVGSHLISIGPICIDGNKCPSKGYGGGSFANHSEFPNAKYGSDGKGNIFLYALQHINEGEFIMCKYSKAYLQNVSFHIK